MTQAEYEAAAAEFRALLAAENEKPPHLRNYPEEWLLVPARVVCGTPECSGSAGTECELGENVDGLYRAFCGVCGARHDTITLLFDDGEVEVQAA